jgi:hypothetical protein
MQTGRAMQAGRAMQTGWVCQLVTSAEVKRAQAKEPKSTA